MRDNPSIYKIHYDSIGERTQTFKTPRKCFKCGSPLSIYNPDKGIKIGNTRRYFCFSHKEEKEKIKSDEYIRKVAENGKKSRAKVKSLNKSRAKKSTKKTGRKKL